MQAVSRVLTTIGAVRVSHALLLVNAGALTIGMAASAALGFVFWWFAARQFSAEVVGLAAAAISMMNLLGHLAEVGLGPLLIGELSKDKVNTDALVVTALAIVLCSAVATGGVYLLATLTLPQHAAMILGSPSTGGVLVLGVIVTAISLVLDQAFVGLLRSSLQMYRNIAFSVIKLALLATLAFAMGKTATAEQILWTWIAGQTLSIAILSILCRPVRAMISGRPRPRILRPFVRHMVSHHALNIVLQLPGLALPLIVTVAISPEINAAFYAAWTIFNVILLVPASLATVLYSSATAKPRQAASQLRVSLMLSLAVGGVAAISFYFFSTTLLSAFSLDYMRLAGNDLRFLGLGVIGVALKYHYVAVQRLRGHMLLASGVLAIGTLGELVAAAYGGSVGGLAGLTEAWLCVVLLQALAVLPSLIQGMRQIDAQPSPASNVVMSLQTISQSTPVACLLIAAALVLPPLSRAKAQSAGPSSFVKAEPNRFVLQGRPFYVAGVNNHYLSYGSQKEILAALDDAVAMNANVVRTFLQPVVGSLDGSIPTIWSWKNGADASNLGTSHHMLFWDTATKSMGINDARDGLGQFDFVLAEAQKRNLKVIVALLDFWAYTGGAQQMSAWYGSNDKYTFFASDPRTRDDYKTWVKHVLTRTNAITGRTYKDDPTVFSWELMNEPDIHPLPLLHEWLTTMSAFVKSIDPHHLVSTGHANVTYRLADLDIATIDFGTWHGYPTYSKQSISEFNETIRDFCRTAQGFRKPVVLEEFGLPRSNPLQAQAYALWLGTIQETPGCAGWVVWRLTSRQDNGELPKDEHDQFDVHNDGSATWLSLVAAAKATREKQASFTSEPRRSTER